MAEGKLTRVHIWGAVVVAAVIVLSVGVFMGTRGGSEAIADGGDAAATPSSSVPDQSCRLGATDACALDLGEDMVLATSAGTTITDNGDGTLTVSGAIELSTEQGGIEIGDAELIVEIPADGGPAEIVGGTGDVPFPTIGFLEQAELIGTSTGLFGTDYGRDIEYLGAFVNPDTKYLWISFSDGMNVATGFATMFPDVDTSALPSSLKVPLGVSATMVIDPIDPYIYIGGACPGFDRPDTEDQTTDSSTSTTSTVEVPDEDDDAAITIGPAAGPGEDCGVGFSLNGLIPFTPPDVDGLPDSVEAYAGHIVIHGEVPLGSTGLAIDGVTIQRLDANGYRLDGYGDVIATVPFVKGLIDLEIPMGDAAAGMEVTEKVSLAYAAGVFGGSQEPLVLPLPIPIKIPNEQSSETRVSASIGGSVGDDGIFRVDADSMLEINGSQGLGVTAFTDLIGVELEDFQTTTGRLLISKEGALLEASTNFGVHPSIDLGAGAVVTAFVDAENLENSFVEMIGLMSFAAVELDGESLLRLDSAGLQAHGRLATAIGGIELDGVIGTAGIDLRGAADLAFPIDVADQLAANIDTALVGAIAEVKKLDDEIVRITDEIKADRRQRSSDFQVASAALDAAQGEVNKIDGDLAKNRSRISDLKSLISDVCSGKSGLALTACQIANAPQVAIWAGEIAALETANVGLEAARFVATGVLDAAQLVLDAVLAGLDAIPVDADPRLITLNTSRDTAIAVLETTRSVAGAVSDGGTLGGRVAVEIGTSGLAGDAAIEWCDSDGCTTLVGAELHLDPAFRACIAVFEIPDICAEF